MYVTGAPRLKIYRMSKILVKCEKERKSFKTWQILLTLTVSPT